MATYIFETMSAADAANFTSSDLLTFQSSVSNLLQADIDEAAGRITFGAFTGIDTGSPVRKSLTFDISDFAVNPVTFSNNFRIYYGSVGDDTIRLTNDGFNHSVSSLGGNDLVEGSDIGEQLYGGTGRDTIRGNGGNDLIGTAMDNLGDYLDGGAGDDELRGNLGNDTLDGGAGNDQLDGSEGDDLLIGGAGNDVFNNILGHSDNPGNDQWIGGPGDDSYGIFAQVPTIVENLDEGIDSIGTRVPIDLNNYPNIENLYYGGTAGATLTGNGLDNVITADLRDNNVLNGGAGNDSISGGGTLNGGAGNDTMHGAAVMNGGDGNDVFTSFNFSNTTVNGGNGSDSIRLDDSENFTSSQIQSVEFIEIVPNPNSDVQITLTLDQLTSMAGTTTFAGSSRNDTLLIPVSAAGSYQLPSLMLSSWLVELPDTFSSSSLTGSRGDSVILSGTQPVDYVLRASATHSELQILRGNGGNDQLIGGNGIDILVGNAGNDTLSGDAGADRMSAGAGNDVINGGDGADIQFGDAGNDSMNGGADADQLYGAEGNDTLIGGAGDDTIEGNAGDDTFDGGDGSDSINGGADNDRIAGGAGDDRIDAGEGHDDLTGGDGGDTLSGGNGNDHLYGQSANGGADGADNISGGDGGDYLQGNAGNDTLDGGAAPDRINGGANDDRIFGGTGNDTINGNLGNDTIDGNADNDSLRGGQGNDSIGGSIGNDTLSGDLGSDTLSGGTGNDSFLFSGQSSPAASPDRITDYVDGTDRLSLGFAPAAVLTGSAQANLADATTLAQSLFDGRAGNQEVAAIAVGSDSYIFYSSSGGATVDSAILLVGVSPSAIAVDDFG